MSTLIQPIALLAIILTGYLFKRAGANAFLELIADLEQGRAPFSPGLAAKILAEFARLGNTPAAHTESLAAANTPALTQRQIQVLTLVAQGQTYKEIGDMLGLTERTVKYHMGKILERLHVKNRAQAIAVARQQGLLAPRSNH